MRLVPAALLLLLAAPAFAQASPLSFTVRADAGAATFGHFLEQRVPAGGERELGAAPAVQLGGALGVTFGITTVEVGVHHAPTELRLRDDSGTGSDALDVDDLADLSLTTVAASIRTGLRTVRLGPVRPYGLAGLSLGVWSVDADAAPIEATDDTQIRFGGETGTGLAIGDGPVSGFVEAVVTSVGNPFDGADAFRFVGGGETFDEPSRVTSPTIRAGLTARF